MKRIRSLGGPPPGLSAYIAIAKMTGVAKWNEFRDYRQGDSYKELAANLIDLQHHLCGYCEIEIGESNRQVEHVIPRSHPQLGAAHALDAKNMIASCLGGAERVDRRARRRGVAAEKLSCGQKKDNRYPSNFVDPRKLPSLPSLLQVRSDGLIEADDDACAKAAQSAGGVTETIGILGLNVERLRMAREAVWRALVKRCRPFLDDRDVMRKAARDELSLRAGQLPPFFTTRRSFFGDLAEDVLVEDPQEWI